MTTTLNFILSTNTNGVITSVVPVAGPYTSNRPSEGAPFSVPLSPATYQLNGQILSVNVSFTKIEPGFQKLQINYQDQNANPITQVFDVPFYDGWVLHGHDLNEFERGIEGFVSTSISSIPSSFVTSITAQSPILANNVSNISETGAITLSLESYGSVTGVEGTSNNYGEILVNNTTGEYQGGEITLSLNNINASTVDGYNINNIFNNIGITTQYPLEVNGVYNQLVTALNPNGGAQNFNLSFAGTGLISNVGTIILGQLANGGEQYYSFNFPVKAAFSAVSMAHWNELDTGIITYVNSISGNTVGVIVNPNFQTGSIQGIEAVLVAFG